MNSSHHMNIIHKMTEELSKKYKLWKEIDLIVALHFFPFCVICKDVYIFVGVAALWSVKDKCQPVKFNSNINWLWKGSSCIAKEIYVL